MSTPKANSLRPQVGVAENRGTLSGRPFKGESIRFGKKRGYPYFGKYPNCLFLFLTSCLSFVFVQVYKADVADG